MINHAIRRFFGLAIVYIVIILGIFAIQFRNEFLINKNIGNLHITLHESVSQDLSHILKNNFQIVYKGISFFADTSHRIQELRADGTKKEITLTSFDIIDSKAEFSFSSGTKLSFTTTGSDETESLVINTKLAPEALQLLIPSRTTSGFKAEQNEKMQSVIFTSNSDRYALNTLLSPDGNLIITGDSPAVQFAAYRPEKEISYAQIASLPLAQEDVYTSTIKQFRNEFVSLYSTANTASSTEKEITAFIAESAMQNKFSSSVKSVSATFKQDGRKTFHSSPYLGNLVSMNKTLVSYYNNLLYKSQQALEKGTLDAFEIERLIPVLFYKNSISLAEKLADTAAIAVADNSEKTLSAIQTAGILNAYCDALSLSKSLAERFEVSIEPLLNRILASFALTKDEFSIKQDSLQGSEIELIRLASALVRYGTASRRIEIQKTGYLLINSMLAAKPFHDSAIYADLYPVLVQNSYYPHLTVLAQNPSIITAWTCSPDVSLTSPTANTLEISLKFPIGDTQYIIVTGLRPFNTIQMYGLNYRSDKQFEMYNSPGYVYDFNTQTLFLKMRHKNEIEKIIFTFSPQAAVSAGATGPKTAAEQ